MLQELVIKVPAPFAGRADIGFSTRYPAQPAQAPLKDVPFIIEGPAGPMRLLQSRLELFRQKRSLNPDCLLYTSQSPRDLSTSRKPSSE